MAIAKFISIAALFASFISAQISLTTQYGPSSFCQGYSPGGGDSCMTVPAGCYIVPSGYNVVPALTCTASTSSIPSITSSPPRSLSTTRSFSSAAAPLSSSAVSIAVSTAKSSSLSAARLSSSAVSIAVSTAKLSQASSSASTPQSISTVSSPSSVAASSPSSSTLPPSASVTAPASTTAGASPASSSAIQSSALPVALSGAVGKVTDAQIIGKTFGDNPSIDTQIAVKQAVDDAKNAAQKAKDAIDPKNTDFDDLSLKLDELLQDLTKATETLAETEALTDMAVALAPELAAAVAAAAAAKALEEKDEDKPSGRPSESQPAKSASKTKSTSPSSLSASSASSSASSSSSACPFCISCADTTLPADAPTDNEEGTIDVPGGGSNSTSSRGRRFARNVNLTRRAQARKSIAICGQTFQSRPYTTGATGNNFRSYGYNYASSTSTCAWTFSFVTGDAGVAPGVTQSKSYQTEHVFEAQLIATFLSSIASKYQNTGNLCSANGLYTRFIARVGAFPGRPGAGVFTGGSPIAELADNLSSDDRLIGNPPESEMVFLDKDLNGLKRAILAEDTTRFNFPPLANAKLAKVTRFAMLRQYLVNPDIVAIWKATSARMHATLGKVDTESAAVMNPTFSWAAEYKTWEDNFLFQQGSLVENALEAAITAAKDSITNDAAIGSQTLRDSFVATINAGTRAPGLADPSDWMDIDDALKMD